jgi:uncharacterized membrane protein
MESIFQTLTSNPLYLAGAGLLLILLVFFVIKKIFKLVIIVVVLTVAYGGYLYFTDQGSLKDLQKKFKKEGSETLERAGDAAKDASKDAIDKVIKDVEKQLKDREKKK